jgi:predicted alpha/beta hydrolase family esterase
MKNALILHGTGADSNSNWFQWMKQKLEEKGCKVWVPDLPNTMEPNAAVNSKYILDNWQFDENSIIIGHSSGAVLALYILQNLPEDVIIDCAFLVSVFKDDLGWPNLKDLFSKPLDWDKIKKHARKIILLHSDNDPYVPLGHAKFVAKKLNTELIIKEGQGHFNLEVGAEYAQFPTLLEIVEGTTTQNT